MRNQVEATVVAPKNRKEKMMLNVSYSANSHFLQIWGDNILRAEIDERPKMVEDFVYYGEIMDKFRKNLLQIEENLTSAEISDLSDAYADLTIFITERSVREQVQWLVEELNNLNTDALC